jgi:hypothetical protein
VWTQAPTRVVLACKIVGESSRSELSGWSDGSWGVALLARETCGRGAVGALAAIEDLR